MYMRFFGLKQEPFSLAPDPRYLYMSKRHREALAHLLYGVGGGGGFVLLSGEIGAGKTTVCRCFLEQIPKRCNVAYIFNPKLTVLELVKSICEEFRIPSQEPRNQPATVKVYVDALNEFLLKTHAVGQNNVLIIDEAQMLSVDVLEQLRLLTNLETSERKLLQIVLIGQPELRTMLDRPDLEQLAQRVIARFHLKALSSKETEHYIRHRLSVAGMTRSIPFDRKALQRIHEIARGVPRRINLLCDRVMLGAYAHGKHVADIPMIEKASREVFGRSETAVPDRSGVSRGAGSALIVFTGLMLVALLAFALYGGWRHFAEPMGAVAAAGAASAASATSAATSTPTPTQARVAALAASSTIAPAATASGAIAAPAIASAASSLSAPPVAASASTAAAPPPAAATAADLKAQLKTFSLDEKAAWRELAALWSVAPSASAPCAAAALQQMRCSKFAATLPMIRSLGRPGFINVRDDAGKLSHVVLVGLDAATATLLANGVRTSLPVAALARSWQGEFGTIWRMPAGYTTVLAEGATGPLVDRLALQLAGLAGEPPPAGAQTMDAALRAKVARFQTAHGLSPLGKAGPTTFMQLNRVTGVDEPRLATAAPSP